MPDAPASPVAPSAAARDGAAYPRRPLVGGAAWRAAAVGFLSSASLGFVGVGRAFALELDVNDGIIKETVAARDRVRHYDTAKSNGAEAVTERSRADDEPAGLRAGNYLIFPSVGAAVVYDNNIFAANTNKQADFRSEITPQLVFKSQLPRHVLDLSLGGRIINYFDHTDQSYASGFADVKGALHFDAAHTLSTDVLTSLEHEERQDIRASQLAAEPVPIWHNRAIVGITRDVGRLYGTLSGGYESWQFGNVRSTTGGVLEQGFRDTDVYNGQVQGGYRFSPGFEVVGRARVQRMENQGDGKVSRSGIGYEMVAGVSLQTSPLLRWKLLGGWGYRDFDQNDLPSTQAFLAEGQVQWLVTQQLTFYGSLSRSISDELAADGGGIVESKAEARLDYEVWRNLVLKASASMAIHEFQGVSRTDHLYSGGVGVEYWANKNWLFTFGYEHQLRDSSDDAFAMSRDKFSIGAKLRF